MNIVSINPEQEADRIVLFIKKTFKDQHIENAVIGLSGGIDSATSFYLLKKALPAKNIFVAHLAYFQNIFPLFEEITKNLPKEHIFHLSIKPTVDEIAKTARIARSDTVRLGNVMARTRMIFLYDLAKKENALVVGTENKSEDLLGYFTRFGDAASDIEPIQHLYKTQIFELAEYLGVPEEIIKQKPSANLWENQTDEGEFGFSYEEADQVLFLHFEEKLSIKKILKKGFKNAEKIIERVKANEHKHQTPYTL